MNSHVLEFILNRNKLQVLDDLENDLNVLSVERIRETVAIRVCVCV